MAEGLLIVEIIEQTWRKVFTVFTNNPQTTKKDGFENASIYLLNGVIYQRYYIEW